MEKIFQMDNVDKSFIEFIFEYIYLQSMEVNLIQFNWWRDETRSVMLGWVCIIARKRNLLVC